MHLSYGLRDAGVLDSQFRVVSPVCDALFPITNGFGPHGLYYFCQSLLRDAGTDNASRLPVLLEPRNWLILSRLSTKLSPVRYNAISCI
jgi:hypothetical protein